MHLVFALPQSAGFQLWGPTHASSAKARARTVRRRASSAEARNTRDRLRWAAGQVCLFRMPRFTSVSSCTDSTRPLYARRNAASSALVNCVGAQTPL